MNTYKCATHAWLLPHTHTPPPPLLSFAPNLALPASHSLFICCLMTVSCLSAAFFQLISFLERLLLSCHLDVLHFLRPFSCSVVLVGKIHIRTNHGQPTQSVNSWAPDDTITVLTNFDNNLKSKSKDQPPGTITDICVTRIEFPHHKTGERKWNKKELMGARSILLKAQFLPTIQRTRTKKATTILSRFRCSCTN